ncbi:MAG: hypothetical protein ACTSPB_03180 [Candidatus Thorarchaeota archaeon]
MSDELEPCKRLLKFKKLVEEEELYFDLNDGYSDWVVCKKCGLMMRLSMDDKDLSLDET